MTAPDGSGPTGSPGTVLVLNAGSSSVKYQLIEPVGGTTLASGLVERVGTEGAVLHHRRRVEVEHGDGREHRSDVELGTVDHSGAIRAMVDAFTTHGPDLGTSDVRGVGHRVVMGGSDIHLPTLIDDGLVDLIDELAPLAPLHNPANAAVIRVARDLLPSVPHVAVFDTAFFHDLPPTSARYAIDPRFAAQRSIRRYGFHGISHEYVSSVVARAFATDHEGRFRQIVFHLGNGASASAVVDGRPVDTSMGFTPLEGLVMGTRSGDIDPSVAFYLVRHHGMSIDEVDHMLNRDSGMLAMAGSNDMRDVHAAMAGDSPTAAADARTALDIYVHRLRHYLGAYAAVMGGLDAVTFTAGVGENDPVVREMAVRGLEFMGIRLDPRRNAGKPEKNGAPPMMISTDDSPVKVLVVATDEELSIAQQTREVISGSTR